MKRRELLLSSLLSVVAITYFHRSQLTAAEGKSKKNSLSTLLAASTDHSLADVSIDWQQEIALAQPFVFGTNDYEILSPQKAANDTFQTLVTELNLPLMRIHHADLCERWSDSAAKSWDKSKIKASYDALYIYRPTIVQNIPNWPNWMQQGQGMLDASEYENYANFCADLVRIINQEQQRNVMYWEPFNERDKRYQEAGKLEELWKIYNLAATKMKAQDPRIKVGGPVLTWDNSRALKSFLRQCDRHVDFISWHRYATGNAQATTDKIMAFTPKYGRQVRKFRSIAAEIIPNRKIPLFLSEYNINYSWESGEERQNTHVGAVWFASVLKHLAEAEIDMAASWHLKDGIYGLMDHKYNLRPSATVFAWGAKYLTGRVAHTESSLPTLEALAVEQPQAKSLLLINKSSEPTQVNVNGHQFQPEKTTVHVLDASGNRSFSATSENLEKINLQPYSLILLTAL